MVERKFNQDAGRMESNNNIRTEYSDLDKHAKLASTQGQELTRELNRIHSDHSALPHMTQIGIYLYTSILA